jgi:hypothetical protein
VLAAFLQVPAMSLLGWLVPGCRRSLKTSLPPAEIIRRLKDAFALDRPFLGEIDGNRFILKPYRPGLP